MHQQGFTLLELAEKTGATLQGEKSYIVTGVAPLDKAKKQDVSFLGNPLYKEAARASSAGIICIDPDTELVDGTNYLISNDPSKTFQIILNLFLESDTSGFVGIHPTAVIHETAKIDPTVQIGPYVVVDKGASIGKGTRLFAFVSVGPNVQIGEDCLIHSHVILREKSEVGNRVVIQPGAVIGSCGFGYITNGQGQHKKLEQLGYVILEDDVEIGANTAIDRARFEVTRIGSGSKIDNLVQIGHNVTIGMNNIVVSQSGIAGSSKTGRNVILGGQSGVVGHVEIGDQVMIASRGGVSKSIPDSGKYAGAPLLPLVDHNRQQVHLRKINSYVKRLEKLEKQLKQLQAPASPY